MSCLIIIFIICLQVRSAVFAQDQPASAPPFVSNNTCEANKSYITGAAYEILGALKKDKDSRMIIIARLGRREKLQQYNKYRLSKVRWYLEKVWDVPSEAIISAEGEKNASEANLAIYVGGKLITEIRFDKGENVDLGREASCESKGDVHIRGKYH